MATIEMTIDGIQMMSQPPHHRVLRLKEKAGDRFLLIWIGPTEADSIAIKLQEVDVPRPLTHDMTLSIINALDSRVKMATISDVRSETLFAELVLSLANKDIKVDCRPSDAIAVAVRANAPIYAEEKVMKKEGVMPPSEEKPARLEMPSHLAQGILSMSSDLAKSDGKDYVETKHLLLALSKQADCIASMVLTRLGINMAKILLAIDYTMTEPNDSGLSVNVKKAIKLAFEEAIRLGDPYWDTDHLLIGLTREGEGIAGKALAKLGVNTEGIFAELLAICRSTKYGSVSRCSDS